MDPSLKLNLAHQLGIAQKLTEFVDANFLGWQNIADARKGCILMALADKSFITFRAIRHLLQDSLFVDDASALVRVQYECIVNALFVFYSPYPVPDDYADLHAANFLVLAISFPIAAEFYGNKLIEPWNIIVREWSGLSPDDPRAKTPPAP
jgi:hypothetical protein